jgi:hypothetical protein
MDGLTACVSRSLEETLDKREGGDVLVARKIAPIQAVG